jgi:hypothetical protein
MHVVDATTEIIQNELKNCLLKVQIRLQITKSVKYLGYLMGITSEDRVKRNDQLDHLHISKRTIQNLFLKQTTSDNTSGHFE